MFQVVIQDYDEAISVGEPQPSLDCCIRRVIMQEYLNEENVREPPIVTVAPGSSIDPPGYLVTAQRGFSVDVYKIQRIDR